jgi:hypothetical protein
MNGSLEAIGRRRIALAAIAFAWPYVIDASEYVVARRGIATAAAVIIAALRYAFGVGAFGRRSQWVCLRELWTVTLSLTIVGTLLMSFDVPGVLSDSGIPALLAYGLIRLASLLMYALMVVVCAAWGWAEQRRVDGAPFFGAAAPYLATTLVGLWRAEGARPDSAWWLHVVLAVLVPLAAGLAVSRFRRGSEK